MDICVQDNDSICKCVGYIGIFEDKLLFCLIVAVENCQFVNNSLDLLGFSPEEEVGGKEPDEFFKIFATASCDEGLQIPIHH